MQFNSHTPIHHHHFIQSFSILPINPSKLYWSLFPRWIIILGSFAALIIIENIKNMGCIIQIVLLDEGRVRLKFIQEYVLPNKLLVVIFFILLSHSYVLGTQFLHLLCQDIESVAVVLNKVIPKI